MRAAVGLAALMLVLLVASCGSDRASTVRGVGSCALEIVYRGHTYTGTHVAVAPREVMPLGTATLPPCDDSGAPGKPEQGEEVELAEIAGVAPTVAVAWHGRDDVVLVRDDVDPHGLPSSLAGLLVPTCRQGDEPIGLTGRWLGIIGIDGSTELDLAPPYDVLIRVTKSSAPRYERAELEVRVPVELGHPLARGDVESSLGDGGTLSLVAHCDAGRLVAERVEAHPPPARGDARP